MLSPARAPCHLRLTLLPATPSVGPALLPTAPPHHARASPTPGLSPSTIGDLRRPSSASPSATPPPASVASVSSSPTLPVPLHRVADYLCFIGLLRFPAGSFTPCHTLFPATSAPIPMMIR
ncbi:uncharacterized protein LOC123429860 isoform X2 [Hordeum vulgare subsp. vulgare]|uniref:uncharacterized protein LOC123429860 isoform X2 n=1 Tax=Hordeum vulgare subsp. vulgare TaxID=112509 RepID=UPI00162CB24C|nr:uncharacterized protein LOC123429860 isoform X2 [Hordeum vulgare subsp. vulgare]